MNRLEKRSSYWIISRMILQVPLVIEQVFNGSNPIPLISIGSMVLVYNGIYANMAGVY